LFNLSQGEFDSFARSKNRRGTHSSGRIRMGQYRFLGQFENREPVRATLKSEGKLRFQVPVYAGTSTYVE
jgi:hypothetical protein